MSVKDKTAKQSAIQVPPQPAALAALLDHDRHELQAAFTAASRGLSQLTNAESDLDDIEYAIRDEINESSVNGKYYRAAMARVEALDPGRPKPTPRFLATKHPPTLRK